jgi:rhodanese-related sulfurtransferase
MFSFGKFTVSSHTFQQCLYFSSHKRIVLKTIMLIQNISVQEAEAKIKSGSPVVVLDVRTPMEFAQRRIPGAVNFPVDDISTSYTMLDENTMYLVICEHGIRSASASGFLASKGFEKICNVLGGMSVWQGEVTSGT